MWVTISSFSWNDLNYIFLDPTILVSCVTAQLVSLPLGQGLAAILPTKCFNISAPSTQAPFQSKNMFAFQSWLILPMLGSTQSMSHLHNMFSMANVPPWASKSCLPLGHNFLASVLVDFFIGLLCCHPVWSGQVLWVAVPFSILFTRTTASMAKDKLPKKNSFGLPQLEVLSGTGSLVTFSQDWACSIGFAGLLQKTLLSMCCLEQILEWEWVPLPLIGQWFPLLLIHWSYLYVPHLSLALFIAHIFPVVVPNECGTWIPSCVLAYCTNSLL